MFLAGTEFELSPGAKKIAHLLRREYAKPTDLKCDICDHRTKVENSLLPDLLKSALLSLHFRRYLAICLQSIYCHAAVRVAETNLLQPV